MVAFIQSGILSAVLLLLRISAVASQNAVVPSVRCYSCNSEIQLACDNPSQLTNLYRDCSGLPGDDRCLKIIGPGVLIQRACGGLRDGIPAGDGCYINRNIQTCMCSTDYCNSSPRTFSSFCVLVFTLVFLAAAGRFRFR